MGKVCTQILFEAKSLDGAREEHREGGRRFWVLGREAREASYTIPTAVGGLEAPLITGSLGLSKRKGQACDRLD